MRQLFLFSLALFFTAGITSVAAAQADDKFYEGRQVKLVVGAALNGSFGIRAHLVSRFMGHHLPGNPDFVLQAISGASGMGAASYIYSAPRDGSTIGLFNSALPFYQATGQLSMQFRTDELSWIGSLGRVVSVVIVWHELGVKSIEEAKTREIILGSTGVRGTTATYPALLNNMFGTRFKIITGYDNNANIYAALERGEVQGVGGAYWSSYQAAKSDWIKDGKIVPLLQMNTKKDPDLPNVPLVTDLATTDEQREILDFILANTVYEYPFAAPPSLPPQRLAILRRAFDETVKDPDFLNQARRLLVEVEPLTGEELTKIVTRIVNAPPAIVAKAKDVMTLRGNQRRMEESD